MEKGVETAAKGKPYGRGPPKKGAKGFSPQGANSPGRWKTPRGRLAEGVREGGDHGGGGPRGGQFETGQRGIPLLTGGRRGPQKKKKFTLSYLHNWGPGGTKGARAKGRAPTMVLNNGSFCGVS